MPIIPYKKVENFIGENSSKKWWNTYIKPLSAREKTIIVNYYFIKFVPHIDIFYNIIPDLEFEDFVFSIDDFNKFVFVYGKFVRLMTYYNDNFTRDNHKNIITDIYGYSLFL